MRVTFALHVCGAAIVIAMGAMLIAVGSFIVGGLVAIGGAAWFARSFQKA